MTAVIRSLRFMQRMERLATALYRAQVWAFPGDKIAKRLRAATANEWEHAETLKERIRALGGTPPITGL